MQVNFGKDFFDLKKGVSTPVRMDTELLINGHALLVGSSGVGKSYTIRKMISQGCESTPGVRFHVFDVHGDLDIPGASEVQFSESARFGLNPLRVEPDPHFGGVRKCIQNFIRTINLASSSAIGAKQEAVIRNLLLDVFRDFGFHEDDASTWATNELEARIHSEGMHNRLYLDVTLADKDRAKALGARWDREKRSWWVPTHEYKGAITEWSPAFRARSYPSLADAAEYARHLYEERFLGTDQKGVRALNEVNKAARTLHKKMLDNVRAIRTAELDADAREDLDKARERALSAYTEALDKMQTGYEFENLLKYDSADVLKSVLDRLNNLKATGIFHNTAPPFDPAVTVWRYKLNALSQEEKKMLVLFTLQDIFTNAVRRGQQDDVVEVVVLDELSTYTSSADDANGDGIIGVIAREARKFGLALWAANQSPAGVPESLISSVAVKIILGIDEMYWTQAVNKLRIDNSLLSWIQPRAGMGVQLKEKGSMKNRWRWVSL